MLPTLRRPHHTAQNPNIELCYLARPAGGTSGEASMATNFPYEKMVLVCTKEKPDGAPSCMAAGSGAVLDAFKSEVARAGLAERVLVTNSGCLGLCKRGPNVIVQPDGCWYTGVQPHEVSAIVERHLAQGQPVERKDPDAEAIRQEAAETKERARRSLAARAAAGFLPEDVDAMARFQPARVLLTAVELDVFSALGDSGASARAVAEKRSLSPHGTEGLLNALVALGILKKEGDRFIDGAVASEFLRAGAPHDARGALMHSVHLWNRWSTLTEAVRQGTSVLPRDTAEEPAEWTEAFIAAMHRNASVRAPIVVGALDLAGVERVLDVGGGSGAYAAQFARAKPDLRATVLDLGSVVPLTRRYLDASGVSDRVETIVGSLHQERLGEGYDLVFLSAICHMLSPEENQELVGKVFQALRPGGRMVIQDFILDDAKTGPKTGALFALNMLVGTERGSAYSGAEYLGWSREAGFAEAKVVPIPGPTDLVVARRE